MRFALAIAALAGLAQPAAADGAWVIAPAPQSGGAIAYVLTSIASAKTANHKLVTTMIYVSTPQDFAGKPASFLMARVEFDCPAKSALTVALQAFDADGKQFGGVLQGSEFKSTDGDPWMGSVEPVACDGKAPEGAIPAANQTDAMQKMKAQK